MSEADLQRLAQILQERGEGLAAINSGEAQLLKALGGAGEALPGTQGMGPAGGPIKSYSLDDGGEDDDDSTESTIESVLKDKEINLVMTTTLRRHLRRRLNTMTN